MGFSTSVRRQIGVLSLLTILAGSFLILQGSVFAPTSMAAVAFDDDDDDDVERIPHSLAGRENCVSCHAPGAGERSAPRDHAGRGNDVCLTCHPLRGENRTLSRADTIPHPLQGWGNCTLCHQPGAGLKPSPGNHSGIRDDACRFCHAAGNASSGTLPGGPILSASRPTPHPLLGRENCFTCHQPGTGIRPSPQSHAGLAMESCLYCHQPVAGGGPAQQGRPQAGQARSIPHQIDGWSNCFLCHRAGAGIRPSPESHRDLAIETCERCHVRTVSLPAPTLATSPALGRGRPVSHGIQGRENCLDCHQPAGGLRPTPASHTGLTADTCLSCHEAAAAGSPYPAIPHPVAGRENCLACHQAGEGAVPAPVDHDWLTDPGLCTNCHQGPATSAPAAAAPAPPSQYPAIPHPIEGREDCLICHQAGGGLVASPTDHDWLSDSASCTNCHAGS